MYKEGSIVNDRIDSEAPPAKTLQRNRPNDYPPVSVSNPFSAQVLLFRSPFPMTLVHALAAYVEIVAVRPSDVFLLPWIACRSTYS
jgi:hypothetical protein